MQGRSTLVSRLFAGVSLTALGFVGQLAFVGDATATCAPGPGPNTTTCSGVFPDNGPVTGGNDYTVNVSGSGGLTSNGVSAITLGNRATVTGTNGSQISTTDSFNPQTVIVVAGDADIDVGKVLSIGKGLAISAGDSLTLLLREGGVITAEQNGIFAGRDADMTISGAVSAATNSGFFNKGSVVGIRAATGAAIDLTSAGSVTNNNGEAIRIEYAGDGSVVEQVATIKVDGSVSATGGIGVHITPPPTARIAPAVPTAPGANALITVGANGSIVSSTAEAILVDTAAPIYTTIRLGGSLSGGASRVTLAPSAPVAVSLNGGDDTFILEPTAANTDGTVKIVGTVEANGQTSADTFALGGTGIGRFDVSLLDGDGVEGPTEQFLGFELFEKRESSTWTLIGANSEVGALPVLGGVLYVNADMPNTAFPVLSGATLGGTGTIGSFDILAGGRFAPGNSIGTLTATGNGVFAAGSFYDVELNAAGATDLVRLAGTTSIQGGTINVLAAPGTYSPQLYTIIDSAGGVTGRFSAVQDNLPDVDFRDIYNPTTVQLELTAQPVTPPGPPAGPGFSVKTNALAAAYGGADASLLFVESLTRRLDGMGGPEAGTTAAVPPLGYDKAARTETLPAVDAIYGADLSRPQPVVELGGLSVFLGAMGEDKSVDDDGGVPGYDAGIGGVLGGLEYTAYGAGRTTLGIAGGYSHTDIDVANGGADLDSGHLGIFASHVQGPLALAGALGYQFGNYDLSRTIGLGAAGTVVASGDADGDAFSGFGEAFYDVGQAYGLGYTIGPVARLRGVTATRDAFVETGAGVLNLSVAEDTISRVYGDIGIRVGTRLAVGDIVLTPQAELRYERTLGDDGDTSFSTIPAAGASFVTAVNDGGRDRIGVGLSMGMEFSTTLAGTVRYDGSFGDAVDAHSGSLALTYKF